MIVGIGTDIVEIKRIEKAVENDRFLRRNFTAAEIELYEMRRKKANVLAGCFAAKEAVAKAFGTGFCGFEPIDVEILRDDAGKPYVNLYGEAEKIRKELDVGNVFVSISNCDNYATAFVVMEKRKTQGNVSTLV